MHHSNVCMFIIGQVSQLYRGCINETPIACDRQLNLKLIASQKALLIEYRLKVTGGAACTCKSDLCNSNSWGDMFKASQTNTTEAATYGSVLLSSVVTDAISISSTETSKPTSPDVSTNRLITTTHGAANGAIEPDQLSVERMVFFKIMLLYRLVLLKLY